MVLILNTVDVRVFGYINFDLTPQSILTRRIKVSTDYIYSRMVWWVDKGYIKIVHVNNKRGARNQRKTFLTKKGQILKCFTLTEKGFAVKRRIRYIEKPDILKVCDCGITEVVDFRRRNNPCSNCKSKVLNITAKYYTTNSVGGRGVKDGSTI